MTDMKILDALNSIILVSDYETNEVLYLNRYAREQLNTVKCPTECRSAELLLHNELLRQDYLNAPLKTGDIRTSIVPSICGMPCPAILESVRLTLDGKDVRIDTIRPVAGDSDDTDSLYTMLFETAFLHLESKYHGIDFPEENVHECLSAAIPLYDADRAFVLELDEELEACRYLYSQIREGYDFPNAEPEDEMLFSNLFSGLIKKGEAFVFTAEELRESRPAEYAWLRSHGIFNAMGVPFTTRTELVAFFGVYNIRRFWKKTSFLSLATKALVNEIRAMRMLQLSKAARHSYRELSNEDVVIKLFGGFEINTNIGTLDLADFSSVQCSRFLLFLIKNRNRTIPLREIADILWPDQLIDNPYNMVKGVAFRVRKILESICPDKLVIAKSGTYAINDRLTIIMDIESFDRLCDRVHSSKLSVLEKQYLYEKALRLYKGDMLPNYESEIWLLGWIGYYQIKYLEILKEYLALLQETEQYAKVFEAVSDIKSIGYADGEVNEIMINALIRLNKPELAGSYYTRVEKYLSAEQKKRFAAQWNENKR